MNKRAQVSMEYLTIFAFVIMLTLPLILIYGVQTKNVREDVLNAQMYKVLSKIGDSAEEVYFQGPPAKKTIRISFPEGIHSIKVNGSYIEATYTSGQSEITITKDTAAILNGTIRTFSGDHVITFTANTSEVFLEDK